MPRESIETVQMRTKYGSMIQDLLRECRNSKNSQLSHTRWEDSLTLLNRIFPSDRDIPIARIGPITTTADDADVWYTTEDDIERMMAQNFILHKPTVVRSRQLGRRGQGLDHFLEALNDHFGDSKVDVQDPSTKTKAAVSSPVCDVIGRIREGADIPAGRLPINLLNLKYLGQVPPAPAFLNLRRFDVLPAISSRLEAELTGQAIAGKRGHAVMVEAREVDLDRSLTFSLFAQRGAFTGFHVDSPDATWVCLEWGLKLWIFATDTNESEMVKFTDEGDNWVPESVVAIVLEPGDTLIMPSAQLLPHAVLTLADSRMTGGMFMDALRILESIEKLLWISIRPSVSNEPIPLQLLRGWSHLRKLFYDRHQSTSDRARFEKITGLLRENLSCQFDDSAEEDIWVPFGAEQVGVTWKYPPTPAHSTSCFMSMCSLSVIFNEILIHMYDPLSQNTDAEVQECFRTQEPAFQEWWNRLAPHLKLDPLALPPMAPPSHIVTMNCLYHTFKILLYRPMLTGRGQGTDESSAQVKGYLVACVTSATAIITIFDLFCRTFTMNYCVLSLAYSVYIAASIFLLQVQATPDAQQAMAKLSYCIQCLDQVKNFSPVINSALNLLTRELAAIGMVLDMPSPGKSELYPAARPDTSMPGSMNPHADESRQMPLPPHQLFQPALNHNFGPESMALHPGVFETMSNLEPLGVRVVASHESENQSSFG
ncbi:C6 transcription factor [Purpureocillium lilacinum]|uniref:C6 transcription factor n=1 Tax=Purpureocillium lilacinum TaxID=33203 RepID=A0A179F783_PURLI|nr:C6 transcription factor [Purpureocillium lilacinum]OAQ61325.1 C6 transcription factor [Purpureocillium lilacinum]